MQVSQIVQLVWNFAPPLKVAFVSCAYWSQLRPEEKIFGLVVDFEQRLPAISAARRLHPVIYCRPKHPLLLNEGSPHRHTQFSMHPP